MSEDGHRWTVVGGTTKKNAKDAKPGPKIAPMNPIEQADTVFMAFEDVAEDGTVRRQKKKDPVPAAQPQQQSKGKDGKSSQPKQKVAPPQPQAPPKVPLKQALGTIKGQDIQHVYADAQARYENADPSVWLHSVAEHMEKALANTLPESVDGPFDETTFGFPASALRKDAADALKKVLAASDAQRRTAVFAELVKMIVTRRKAKMTSPGLELMAQSIARNDASVVRSSMPLLQSQMNGCFSQPHVTSFIGWLLAQISDADHALALKCWLQLFAALLADPNAAAVTREYAVSLLEYIVELHRSAKGRGAPSVPVTPAEAIGYLELAASQSSALATNPKLRPLQERLRKHLPFVRTAAIGAWNVAAQFDELSKAATTSDKGLATEVLHTIAHCLSLDAHGCLKRLASAYPRNAAEVSAIVSFLASTQSVASKIPRGALTQFVDTCTKANAELLDPSRKHGKKDVLPKHEVARLDEAIKGLLSKAPSRARQQRGARRGIFFPLITVALLVLGAAIALTLFCPTSDCDEVRCEPGTLCGELRRRGIVQWIDARLSEVQTAVDPHYQRASAAVEEHSRPLRAWLEKNAPEYVDAASRHGQTAWTFVSDQAAVAKDAATRLVERVRTAVESARSP